MPNEPLSARVEPAVIARVEACAAAHNERREPGTPKIDRGAIVRMLIHRGLPAMEAELGLAPPDASAKNTRKTAAKGAKSTRKTAAISKRKPTA